MILSICIPTYNRAKTIGALLDSIEKQITTSWIAENVEVVIFDNASTDETQEIVHRFLAAGRVKLRYFSRETNVGFGRNISDAIDNASGAYCWLMGSDDVILDGAISNMLSATKLAPDIVMGNVLTNGIERKLSGDGRKLWRIDTDSELFHFFKQFTEISSLFAFISSLVVRRDFWINSPMPVEFIPHPYTHMLRIFYALAIGEEVVIYSLNVPVVDTGNEENELTAKVARHFSLDLETLDFVSRVILQNNAVDLEFGRIFLTIYSRLKFRCARAGVSKKDWERYVLTLSRWGCSKNLLKKSVFDDFILVAYLFCKFLKRIVRS